MLSMSCWSQKAIETRSRIAESTRPIPSRSRRCFSRDARKLTWGLYFPTALIGTGAGLFIALHALEVFKDVSRERSKVSREAITAAKEISRDIVSAIRGEIADESRDE